MLPGSKPQALEVQIPPYYGHTAVVPTLSTLGGFHCIAIVQQACFSLAWHNHETNWNTTFYLLFFLLDLMLATYNFLTLKSVYGAGQMLKCMFPSLTTLFCKQTSYSSNYCMAYGELGNNVSMQQTVWLPCPTELSKWRLLVWKIISSGKSCRQLVASSFSSALDLKDGNQCYVCIIQVTSAVRNLISHVWLCAIEHICQTPTGTKEIMWWHHNPHWSCGPFSVCFCLVYPSLTIIAKLVL